MRVRAAEQHGGVSPAIAARAVLRLGDEARRSLSSFYGFVMRHEISGAPIRPAPHQQVMLSFIDAHPRCVIRVAVGLGKTYAATAFAMRSLGEDPTARGAIVSKTTWQAQKPLGMIQDYMTSPRLRDRLILAYPNLKPSRHPGDPWAQGEMSVDRPRGIRDPSLIAVGVAGSVAGSRLAFMLLDDVVDDENSATPQLRAHLASRIEGRFLSRLDPSGSRAVMFNTPWHREDATYHLELNSGWPALSISAEGDIWYSNASAVWAEMAERIYLRPARRSGRWRLRAHDPDPRDSVPAWPARYTAARLAELRRETLPHEYARTMLCEPFDERAARCRREWVEACKRRGLGLGLVSQYDGDNPTFTGIDLGIGTDAKFHDKTVMHTFEVQPDGSRRILDIESGRWDGKVIVDKAIGKHEAYRSALRVETVQGQDFMRQWILKERRDIPVHAHTTGANKRRVDFGVESIFTEFQNEAWILPCDKDGRCHPEVQSFIDDCLYYQPGAHTGDHLIAAWIAREQARSRSGDDPSPRVGRRRDGLETGGF